MSKRTVTFSAEERARLAEICKALGTTFGEFVHFATMRAVDECEGYGRDAGLVRAFYNNDIRSFYNSEPVSIPLRDNVNLERDDDIVWGRDGEW